MVIQPHLVASTPWENSDDRGDTPLHYAAGDNSKGASGAMHIHAAVRLLLEGGHGLCHSGRSQQIVS